MLIISFGITNITERRERSIELPQICKTKTEKHRSLETRKKTKKKWNKKKKKEKSDNKDIAKKGKDFGREN
jgi:hypothetical protein